MKFPLLAKVGAIALVGLMLVFVLSRIEGLVQERKGRGEEAVRGVERSHAAAQSVVGPLLQRECTEEWDVVTGTGKDRVVTPNKREFTLMQVPNRLAVDGRTKADPLWRGLFKINAYAGHFSVAADFVTLTPLQPKADHEGGKLRCAAPVLLLALSDVRGVRAATVNVDGQALDVQSGTSNAAYARGLHATLASARADGDAGARPLSVRLELDLIGTSKLGWVPAADSTRWTLNSDWPSPSFGGQFSPADRAVRADGFTSTWNLSSLATSAPADIAKGLPLCTPTGVVDSDAESADGTGGQAAKCLDVMSVAFIDPVNPYVLSDRAVKYDLLFIALTFIAVGLIEVLSGRRVHPVQYLLVGLALSLFFLLLLSLSEHLAFETAYAAAATACALLLGFYASSMLGRLLSGVLFGLGIALLYGVLYVLLQMEQNALVIGSVMLFVGLAVVMMLTRRIDWYALFARLRAPVAPAAADARG
ncbi:MAG: cell envelope integrity protein CreD [Burkholderiaceae bacterium]|jgi:inner membrane protein